MDETTYPLAVIPARGGSSRFPNKPLARILGKPMIQYVWEAAAASPALKSVVVATDSADIHEAVRSFGGRAVMTSPEFASGSDRVAWVAGQLGAEPGDIVVNLQGDEPLIQPESLDGLVQSLLDHPRADWATLAVRKSEESELHNPNVVKVVFGADGSALYFSRAPLRATEDTFFKHVGVYAFRYGALKQFCDLPVSPLERAERLEQLRALENGFRIQIIEIPNDTVAVDVPGDVGLVEQVLNTDIRTEGRHP